MKELVDFSVRELLALMNSRQVSSVDICREFLQRINESESINAVVFVDSESVLADAQAADRARAQGNSMPLLGIPFSVKDSIAVAHWPWRSGSYARESVIADRDATTVARIRSRGGIPLCKTATPEYTWSAQTNSALHGRTNNPYDLVRSAGGSSGGEAALHAVHGAPFGLGTDGLNSIRVPAHFCGSAGLRPTAGVISEAGTWPLTRQTGMGDISTIGPMGRFAGDLDLLLEAISGVDPEDPFVHPLGGAKTTDAIAGMSVGVLPSSSLVGCSSATLSAITSSVAEFEALGAHMVELKPWDTSVAVELAFALMAPDGGAKARRNLAGASGRHTQEFADLLISLEAGRVDIDGYLSTLEWLTAYRGGVRKSLMAVDFAILPVANGSAPLHDRLPGNDDTDYDVSAFAHSFAIALAGVPSAVVPVGMDGALPIGVQLVSNAHEDSHVLRLASALQDARSSFVLAPTAWKR
jgi:amidase